MTRQNDSMAGESVSHGDGPMCRCGHQEDDHGSAYEQRDGEKVHIQRCAYCECQHVVRKGGPLDQMIESIKPIPSSLLIARKYDTPCFHAIAVANKCLACGEDVTPYRQERKRLGQIARAAKQEWLEISTASDPHDEYEAMAIAVARAVRSCDGQEPTR